MKKYSLFLIALILLMSSCVKEEDCPAHEWQGHYRIDNIVLSQTEALEDYLIIWYDPSIKALTANNARITKEDCTGTFRIIGFDHHLGEWTTDETYNIEKLGEKMVVTQDGLTAIYVRE